MQLQLDFSRRLSVVLQSERSECALACLCMISSYYGDFCTMLELRSRFSTSSRGANLKQLIQMAAELNLSARPLRIELDHLKEIRLPAILHWNLNHYVVLKKVTRKFIILHDPGAGVVKLTHEQASKSFTGIALELCPALNYVTKPKPRAISLSKLTGRVAGLKRSLIQLISISFAIEITALTLPIFIKWITDETIVAANHELLSILCLAMLVSSLTGSVLSMARSWLGIHISTQFNVQWMKNVMDHLLHLPVSFFERRHLGDIVSRFGAIRIIENGLTSAVADSLIDGMLAICSVLIMFVFSPFLTLVCFTTVVLYGFVRWLRYGSLQAAASSAIAKQAKEQTYFLETVRGARGIKLYGREAERSAAWINLWVDTTNSTLVTQKINLMFTTLLAGLGAIEQAYIFWIGINGVITELMSLGTFLAFMTYKDQFSRRMSVLIDRVVEFRMLTLHGERLADIVLTPTEAVTTLDSVMPVNLELSLKAIEFKYSPKDSLILRGISLNILPGECIAITGVSGCGKTTLLKLLTGIIQPTNGEILVGGVGIDKIGLGNFRGLIGTVMQDDILFSGSLLDNIAFMDELPDLEWLYDCTRAAEIHTEIMQMPMGYRTMVGDMGSSLSGGQKQRIMLARALYKKPKFLFLDEATSHLDDDNEIKISMAISKLNITRIIIAHRHNTIASAERVYKISEGLLQDISETWKTKNMHLSIISH